MVRVYEQEDVSVTDQEVARYERQVKEGLEVDVEISEGPYSEVEIDGEIESTYRSDSSVLNNSAEEEQLALGIALGRYLFEDMSEWRWEQEPAAQPIFSELDTPLIEKAEEAANISSDYFEHGFLNQREISERLDFYQIEDPEGLSPAYEELNSAIQEPLDKEDLSTSEIVERISEGEIEVEADSAKYRSWTSEALNELAERGLIGRYKDGREVKYTASPERGFQGQVLNSDFELDQKNNFLEYKNRPVTEQELGELTGSRRQPREVMEEFSKRVSWRAINK
jgi:hypothetical protein